MQMYPGSYTPNGCFCWDCAISGRVSAPRGELRASGWLQYHMHGHCQHQEGGVKTLCCVAGPNLARASWPGLGGQRSGKMNLPNEQ